MLEAIKEFNKIASTKKTSNAYYGVIDKKGHLNIEHTETYCHAGISRYFGHKDIDYFIVSVQNPYCKVPISVRDRHIKWLVENSVWSQFIENKSGEDAIENGILFNNKIPQNLLKSGCIVSRMATENHPSYGDMAYQSILWDKFCSRGMDPTLAYAFTYLFHYSFEENTAIKKEWSSYHLSISPFSWSFQSLCNFVEGKYDDDTSVLARPAPKGLNLLWQGQDYPVEGLVSFVDSLIPPSLSKKANTQIFLFNSPEQRVFSTEEDFDYLVERINDYYYSGRMGMAA